MCYLAVCHRGFQGEWKRPYRMSATFGVEKDYIKNAKRSYH